MFASEAISRDPADSLGAPVVQTRIGFRLHPELPWMILPAALASQWVPAAVLAPVPNVKSWFVGVLNQRGLLVPVFDIGLWRGLAPLQLRKQVLILAPGPEAIGVVCCLSARLLQIDRECGIPSEEWMQDCNAKLFASEELGDVVELDPRVWLRKHAADVPGFASTGASGRSQVFVDSTETAVIG